MEFLTNKSYTLEAENQSAKIALWRSLVGYSMKSDIGTNFRYICDKY